MKGINYNTYALGRDGYFSLNLLTTSTRVNTDKGAAHELLAALNYNSGKAYEDFNSATDNIAASYVCSSNPGPRCRWTSIAHAMIRSVIGLRTSSS